MGEEAPREVVLERSPRSVLVPLFPLALALAAFVTTLYGLYYSVVLWRIEGSMARLVEFSLMASTIGVFVVWEARALRHHLLEEAVVIGPDGLRTRGRDGTLREISFDGEVWVSAYSGGDGVSHLRFQGGLWNDVIVNAKEYEDLVRALPMVRAAVEKHGMRAGENLRKLMDSEDGS